MSRKANIEFSNGGLLEGALLLVPTDGDFMNGFVPVQASTWLKVRYNDKDTWIQTAHISCIEPIPED